MPKPPWKDPVTHEEILDAINQLESKLDALLALLNPENPDDDVENQPE